MRALTLTCLAVAMLAAGCDAKIGDSCSSSTDCSPSNTRICDLASPGGYCTVGGCDVGTCPDDAICVQYFSVVNVDRTCAGPADCTLDEICTVGGKCAPRSSEVRFCMNGCGSHGDCRSGYECRDVERMGAHGGQPVRREGQLDEDLPAFCAPSARCSVSDQTCDLGDTCDLELQRCIR
jgi:hypothetical protein